MPNETELPLVSGDEVRDLVKDYGMVIVDDERVIIRTKLEKPSKIKGLALIESLFLYHFIGR